MSEMSDPRNDGESTDSSLQGKKREFLESFFKKGAEFTRELLRENDRLRRRALQLEQELAQRGKPAPSAETLAELVRKLHELEEEKHELLERVAAVQGAGTGFSDRYEEIEQENNDLASLFVAQSQLHASLDVPEVVRVIVEILLNFVGAERFALLAPDASGALQPLAVEGLHPDLFTDNGSHKNVVSANESTGSHDASHMLRSISQGASAHVDPRGTHERRRPGDDSPSVCLSLADSSPASPEHPAAVICIWAFLPQKGALQDLDLRIFDLLGASAGRALEAALLASSATSAKMTPTETPRGRYEAYREKLDRSRDFGAE